MQRKRVYCPHCEEYVSRSLFYEHKNLHYDESGQKWRSNRTNQDLQVSYEFSPSDVTPMGVYSGWNEG